jgi:hypothetical protein
VNATASIVLEKPATRGDVPAVFVFIIYPGLFVDYADNAIVVGSEIRDFHIEVDSEFNNKLAKLFQRMLFS